MADDMSRGLVDATGEPEERALEAAMRPKNFDEFVGQSRVRERIFEVAWPGCRSRLALRPSRSW